MTDRSGKTVVLFRDKSQVRVCYVVVGELEQASVADHEVLRLDIAMEHAFRVNCAQLHKLQKTRRTANMGSHMYSSETAKP